MRPRTLRVLAIAGAMGLGVAATAVMTTRRLEAKAKNIGSISFVSGDAMRVRGDGQTAIKKGLALREGDRLKTEGGARLEAQLADGSLLRLGSSSELSLENVAFDKKKKRKVKAKLMVGRVWAAVRSWFGSEDNFEVETVSAVAGVRGTRFSAEQSADGTATVKVYSGKVLVSNAPVYAVKGHTKETRKEVAGPQEVSQKQYMELIAGAMQLIQVAANGDVGNPSDFQLASAGDDAEWEKWNAERDNSAGFAAKE